MRDREMYIRSMRSKDFLNLDSVECFCCEQYNFHETYTYSQVIGISIKVFTAYYCFCLVDCRHCCRHIYGIAIL